MTNILKNDFSWSLQRFAMFERCKREYFYHYYDSWEGWNENAGERTKLVYRLKNIKTEEIWLKSIIEKTLSSAIKMEIEFSLLSCKSFSIRAAYRDIFELERQEYLKDPKKLCLDSFYFSEESVGSLKKQITAKLECFWGKIWGYVDFVRIGGLGEFVLDNIKVWVNPGIVYIEEDKRFIIDIYPAPQGNEIKPTFSIPLAILFLKETYRHMNGKYVPRTIIVDKDKCIVLEECLPVSGISELLRKSSTDMLSYLTFDKKAYEENFPRTSRKEKCHTCRFREACAA
jgi:hypothetical protein